jgi:putative ABC transport system substrate-binding protein
MGGKNQYPERIPWMRRKLFLLPRFAATLFLLVSSQSKAGETSRIPRIGILVPESGQTETQTVKGLRDGLKELGYKERENIFVEMRDAKGNPGALKPMADELVSIKVSLIFTTGTRATLAAKAATSQIPLVFRHPTDPEALGFVKSIKRPGGNVTGVAAFSKHATEKRLEILKEVVPTLQRLHIFYDSNSSFSRENFAFAKEMAAKKGIEVAEHQTKTPEDLKNALNQLQKRDGDAIFHVSDDLIESQAAFVFDLARQKRIPTIFDGADWAVKGSTISYGANYSLMGRQAARLIDKILKGAKPGDLPVERAEKFDFIINYRTARIIGLSIPPEVLKKADKVIR